MLRVLRTLAVLSAGLILFLTSVAAPAHAQPAESSGRMQQIMAGQAFRTAFGGQCTTGFSVRHTGSGDGFLAAAYCGDLGDTVFTMAGTPLGVVAIHTSGWLWVDLAAGFTAAPYVYPGHPVTDGIEAPIGSSICRTGVYTGWHCGTIVAKNQTISYPGGVLYGLTRTNICPEPGYSGGPYLSGSSAQGIDIGGSGNCSTGGASYFVPLKRVWSAVPALSLITT